MYLYMLKIGATPKGRLIEQHDIFFGIADDVRELIPHFESAWPEIKDIWHLDAYRKITAVDGYLIEIINKDDHPNNPPNVKHLYFVNLGGYKPNHFEEYHHKLLIIADDIHQATAIAKQSEFYQAFDIAGTRATSHIDDKYGVDIDEIHNVSDVLPQAFKDRYRLRITADSTATPDEMVIGYLPKKMFV
ncbi:hypothetical protein B0681_04475 [Moraxella porci DSM 25326]|uniref:DUF1543 domain-containing protein n=1 Tax=Moraxella porci DSM 25326 TaxID=573983 RepID=A0A1T0CSU3_9GAMM|nr:DUF1543 domain-containing protein [Moraxella porci]OOS25289.1 hypothetical protein B0681_04475 [Moraxella porci DSM 25326]